MRKISFIGTGNMGGAILRAVCKRTDAEGVFVSNRSFEKSRAVASETGCIACRDNAECARGADIVFIGVKPEGVRGVLAEISSVLRPDTLVVSMAAGVDSAAMIRALGRKAPIVRILPNTPCAIGRGLVLLAPCGDVEEGALAELEDILSGCGMTARTDETHADAGMTVGGCTPAFTYMFIEALADGGVAAGLPRDKALAWAAQAVAGAAEMVLKSGEHPGRLKDRVCSPGGSTIQGVRALEEHGLRAAAMDAVIRAFEKNGALGK